MVSNVLRTVDELNDSNQRFLVMILTEAGLYEVVHVSCVSVNFLSLLAKGTENA